jgi:hypothetical protein
VLVGRRERPQQVGLQAVDGVRWCVGLGRVQAEALQGRREPGHRQGPRIARVAGIVWLQLQAERGRRLAQHGAGVFGGVDRWRIRAEAQTVGPVPQHAQAERVKGGDVHLLGSLAEHARESPTQSVGRRRGEGERQDAGGRHAPPAHQVRDTASQDGGLPATWAGQDGQRPVVGQDRLALGRRETLKAVHVGRSLFPLPGSVARLERRKLLGTAPER